MSTNHTPNYSLSQWQAADQVLRTDFNADNAKIDAALRGFEARMATLERLSNNLAHYIGYLGLLEYRASKTRLPSYSMFTEDFSVTALYTLTGGAVIANNTLSLSGRGKTADAVTVQSIPNHNSLWTQALLWVHTNTPDVAASFDGQAMTHHSNTFSPPVGQSSSTWEMVFTLDRGENSSSGKLALHLDCTDTDNVTLYDYCMFFI